VFARTATIEQAEALWKQYMIFWAWTNILFAITVLLMWLIMWGIDYLCGTYFESVFLSTLIGGSPSCWAIAMDVLIFVTVSQMQQLWLDSLIGVCVALPMILRAYTILLTRKGIIGLDILVTIVLGLFLRIVISYGVTKSRRKENE
jgi:hypothetical protein